MTELEKLREENAERDAAIRKECAPEWISVEDKLPLAKEHVLATYRNNYGKARVAVAQYIPPKTVEAHDFLAYDAEGGSEFDDETDTEWVIEGWWEGSWEADTNWKISDKITHWMPLPEPPIRATGGRNCSTGGGSEAAHRS